MHKKCYKNMKCLLNIQLNRIIVYIYMAVSILLAIYKIYKKHPFEGPHYTLYYIVII